MKSNNFILQETMNDVSLCDDLIKYYEQSENKEVGSTSKGVIEENKRSTEVYVPLTAISENPFLLKYILNLQSILEKYIQEYPMSSYYDSFSIVENIKIQHYKPTEGYTAYHTERGSNIKPACDRHLVFMTYLNDVTDGGETEFYHQDLKVKPQKGLTLIWPADWTHTHRGVISPTQNKYIITGWFNYV